VTALRREPRPAPVRAPWRGPDRAGEILVVREASASDARSFLAHMRRITSETPYMLQGEEDTLPTVGEQRELFRYMARSPNSAYFVAVRPHRPEELRICGSATLLGGRTARTMHACSLGMGVDREDWGRGVGGLLLDVALTWARGRPMLRRMGLQVYEDNVRALHLYRSRGFTDEGLLRDEARVDGNPVNLLGMGVDVGAPP